MWEFLYPKLLQNLVVKILFPDHSFQWKIRGTSHSPFQRFVRNKPVNQVKFQSANVSRCEIPPLPPPHPVLIFFLFSWGNLLVLVLLQLGPTRKGGNCACPRLHVLTCLSTFL